MQLGGGIEFADHREYTPGDDFRYLDWNLYARHDELLLKRFQEEEDLHVYFLLDCSRSMAFGDAAEVRLRPAGGRGAGLHRPGRPRPRGRHRVRRRHRGRLPADPRQGADPLAAEVPREPASRRGARPTWRGSRPGFVHRDQRRGLAVVVSDLYDPGGFERGLDLLRHHRYEPHVVQIYDRREADPTCSATWSCSTSRPARSAKVTVTERNLRQYRQIFERFQESVQRYCNTLRPGLHADHDRDPVRRADPEDDAARRGRVLDEPA